MISFINKSSWLTKVVAFLLLSNLVSVNLSCKKMLDVESTRLATEEAQWKNLQDTRSGLMGIYNLMRTALGNNNAHWLWGEMREGDFTASSKSDLKAIIRSDLNASYPLIQNITNWRSFYAVINSASLFIERSGEVVAKDPRYSKLNNKVDIAQARALRAFAYFYMVRIWGDVPLITASHDGTFEGKPRTDQAKVLGYAESELIAAAKDLPYRYGVDGDAELPGLYYGYNYARWAGALFTKISAYAIMSHIAAWQSHYLDAAVYTQFVMENYKSSNLEYVTTAQLTASDGIFNGQDARIPVGFTFSNTYGESTSGGHIEQLVLAEPLIAKQIPDLYVSKDTINKAFTETKDGRFGIDTLSGLTRTNYFLNYSGQIPVFSKIKVLRGGTTSGSFVIFSSSIAFTRLEELALLRAEALAVLGQRQPAIDLLNIIKKNRGTKSFNDLEGLDLINEIFAERRRELMGEGWRWYDRIRLAKIKGDDAKFNKLIAEKGIYWPIAKDVLKANGQLVQNSYWK
ncbi:RagB/SusD family nutrient uptake outer membrane protein [Pedobacter sp. N36a]|uniref:RagB/SusD family nutrient uptake outer membrane protein n=1 Tax=Pedobacter sp. N36a TaxID=2767996 RepID=UPI0016575D41|nr:RagB/SusD family nutrient uptake outer membrane protein [Pedobacter sp. N36a]MBC8986309.1 RagB/SusD family nutrient uptake outer membrane protein [Pedobacter sp. N36a]